VKPADLVVDRFTVEVLKGAPEDAEAVTLDEHGRWSVEEEAKEDNEEERSQEMEPGESKLQRCLSARAIMESGSIGLCPSPGRVRRLRRPLSMDSAKQKSTSGMQGRSQSLGTSVVDLGD